MEGGGFFVEHEARIKAAMIVYALEKALATLATKKDLQQVLEQIEQVSAVPRFRGREDDGRSPRSKIENLYLEEIFQYAERVLKGTSQETHIRRLRSLCEGLCLFDIRNAVSHPARSFPACYWYRAASIASDPSILMLGLDEVRESLVRAEAGNIHAVPDEWIGDQSWSLPARLPSTMEHEGTSLIGREKERSRLLSLIKNRRLATVAVVAPGGTGKTALVLDVLLELTQLPETQDWLDGVIFLSLKQEELTGDGVRELDAPSTIVELKRQCASEISRMFGQLPLDDLSEVADLYSEERLIICFDNLETVLRDQQEPFVEFCNSLPSDWRVLVTSRVTVEGASTFPIAALNSGASLHLARVYSSIVGIGGLGEEVLGRIANDSGGNPLAIRLMIDRVALGHELPKAIEAISADVAEFSYQTLMDVLDDSDVEFLECLYAKSSLSRGELCGYLGIGLDEVAERIAKVTKTSLVIRDIQDGQEHFELNGAVRRLVLLHPRNIAIRERVARRIAQGRLRARDVDEAQRNKGVDRFDARYIPADTPDELKALCGDALKVLFRRKPDLERVAAIQRRFNAISERFSGDAVFHRFFARVLAVLNDNDGTVQQLRLALAADSDDVLSRLELSRRLSSKGFDYEEALAIAMPLFEEGLSVPEQSGYSFARQVTNCVFLPLLYLGRYDDILSFTERWEGAGAMASLLGVYRAAALKRKAEPLSPYEAHELVPMLDQAVAILSRVIALSGLAPETRKQARNLAEDIAYRLHWSRETNPLIPDYAKNVLRWLKFLDAHLVEIYSGLPGDGRGNVGKVLAAFKLEGNPFLHPKWTYILGSKQEAHQRLHAAGFQLVTISAIPRSGDGNFSRFIFAKDANGRSHYLNFNVFQSQDVLAWAQLKVGDEVAISCGDASGSHDRAIAARCVMLPGDDPTIADSRWAPLRQLKGLSGKGQA